MIVSRMVCSVVLLFALPVLAAGSGAPADGETALETFAARFHTLDRNDDGRVSNDEFFAGLPLVVELMDGNADGVVSQDEFLAFRRQVAGAVVSDEQAAMRRDDRFRALDTDNDRQLTYPELERRKVALLQVFDPDGDGMLTLREVAERRQPQPERPR